MSQPLAALEQARARARHAGADGDWTEAARWAERAWRLADRRPIASLELAASLARIDDDRATRLLAQAAKHHADFPVLVALAASQRRKGAHRAAQATLHRLLTTVALDALQPASDLACDVAADASLGGWLGWRDGRLLFGSADGTPDRIGLALDRQTLTLDWRAEAPRVWSAALPPDTRSHLHANPPLLGAPLRPAHFSALDGRATRNADGIRGFVWFPNDPERQPVLTLTVQRHGRTREVSVPVLTASPPTETAPFARRRMFDVSLRPGETVLAVTETGSGRTIPLAPVAGEAPSIVSIAPPIPDAEALIRQCQTGPCILLVTHDEGGGVERFTNRRVDKLRRAGRVGLLLRSSRDRPGAVRLGDIAFQLPAEGPALMALLRSIAPVQVEYHHLRRHNPLVWQLAASLGVPYDVFLHDYALICPRVTLVGADGRYCGEPPVSACERCVLPTDRQRAFAPQGVDALRRRSAALLEQARTVRAPSADTAARFRRYAPAAAVTVRPWERLIVPGRPARYDQQLAKVCVAGALNQHKGFDILLECARDAAIRGLPLRFVVVGHTSDDDALIGAGAFVTGPFAEGERAELIARQRATVGFLPSIWPEPWCYSLTGLLQAGLPTLCFDIGAQAVRVRAAGGAVVPLETPAAEINQQLINLHRLAIKQDLAVA